jgi:hypothetical protein
LSAGEAISAKSDFPGMSERLDDRPDFGCFTVSAFRHAAIPKQKSQYCKQGIYL